MSKRKTALIVILVIAIIGGPFFLKGKTSKNSANTIATTDTTKKPYMTVEEALNVVKRLEDLGYYKYADLKDLDTLRKDLISSLANYGVLSTVSNEKTFVPLDNRLFFFDGETLFEQEGLKTPMGETTFKSFQQAESVLGEEDIIAIIKFIGTLG
jgi:hypothetical protein